MADTPIKNHEQPEEERIDWVRPEVNRMRAGEAENAALAAFDGGAGLS